MPSVKRRKLFNGLRDQDVSNDMTCFFLYNISKVLSNSLISKLDMQNFAIRREFSNFLKSSLYAAAVQKDSSLNSNRTGQYWKPPDLPGQEMSIQCHLLAGRTAKGRSKITFLSTVLGHKRIGCRHKFVLCLFNCFWAQKQKANHSNKMQTYIGKCLLTKRT